MFWELVDHIQRSVSRAVPCDWDTLLEQYICSVGWKTGHDPATSAVTVRHSTNWVTLTIYATFMTTAECVAITSPIVVAPQHRIEWDGIFSQPSGGHTLLPDSLTSCSPSRVSAQVLSATRVSMAIMGFQWSDIRGLNSSPSPWQGDALPNELIPHM